MAYPYNYAAQPYYIPPQQPAQNNGLIWVQGEAGARSYFAAPGTNTLLMDSDSQRFYIKSVDPSGMPKPLRTFEYKEVFETQQAEPEKYVTHDELDRRLAELKGAEKHEPLV